MKISLSRKKTSHCLFVNNDNDTTIVFLDGFILRTGQLFLYGQLCPDVMTQNFLSLSVDNIYNICVQWTIRNLLPFPPARHCLKLVHSIPWNLGG